MPVTTPVNITETMSPGSSSVAYGQGGLEIEFFRIPFAAGVAVGENFTLSPRRITNIRAVQSNHSVTDDLDPLKVNSSVTLTARAAIASSASGEFMMSIIGSR